MNHTINSSTKDRILDSAELLFAEHGFNGTSLRMITTEASVNLAAVNYHFQSKDALLDALIQRRATPINQRRLHLLAQYETESGSEPVPVEKLLDAFIRPMLEFGTIVPRLIVRLQLVEPSHLFKRIFETHLRVISQRFIEALMRTLPNLPPQEVFLRMHFVIGAFAQLMAAGPILQVISEGRFPAMSQEETIRRLIHFAAAGLKSPAYEEANVQKS